MLQFCRAISHIHVENKANLKDLIASTGLVILFKLDSNHWFFSLFDLEIRWMTSTNNRAPPLGQMKLCALFQSHQWIKTGVSILKIWRMALKKIRAPLLSNIKLCSSFHHHMWIQTGVTFRKQLSCILTAVTLTFYPWPWSFVWTSLSSLVINPENFMIIR